LGLGKRLGFLFFLSSWFHFFIRLGERELRMLDLVES
jgi:hypothetical protein